MLTCIVETATIAVQRRLSRFEPQGVWGKRARSLRTAMRPAPGRFIVTLELAGEDDALDVPIEALTPFLAVNAAEAMHPAGRAVEVLQAIHVYGRCERCGAVILDREARRRASPPGCPDC